MEDLTIRRRKLPHWEFQGSIYFVTFTCVPGLVLNDAAKNVALSSLCFHSGKKYRLLAGVVMETHVHLLLQPLDVPAAGSDAVQATPSSHRADPHSLARITHSIKSYSAHKINRIMSRSGRVWLDESHDRIVRDDHELIQKFDYVVLNPVQAGLVQKPEDYTWLFVDPEFRLFQAK